MKRYAKLACAFEIRTLFFISPGETAPFDICHPDQVFQSSFLVHFDFHRSSASCFSDRLTDGVGIELHWQTFAKEGRKRLDHTMDYLTVLSRKTPAQFDGVAVGLREARHREGIFALARSVWFKILLPNKKNDAVYRLPSSSSRSKKSSLI